MITIITISHVTDIMTVMQYFQSGDPPGPPTSPLQLTPVLVESQIARIADTAATLVKSLPDLEPKQPNIKKKICKELEVSLLSGEPAARAALGFSKHLLLLNLQLEKSWQQQQCLGLRTD